MPRSAPGPAMLRPSSSTSPDVCRSSPATMRSSVLLPQPEGPRMVMKSFSATCRSVSCSATVGAPPLVVDGKLRETPRTDKKGVVIVAMPISRAAPTETSVG